VLQQITHEKVLVDCDKDFENFVEVVSGLGKKLDPMLLQFPYFNRAKFKTGAEFTAGFEVTPEGLSFYFTNPNESAASN
jgi:uncharacterized protein YecE (DUF72 family)